MRVQFRKIEKNEKSDRLKYSRVQIRRLQVQIRGLYVQIRQVDIVGFHS
jgi:hypothetical protein